MTRIIAGRAGSLRLEVPKSGTRPTSDRVREAIFSALEAWGLTEGARVLDLYAGSGALGLEAASRGARKVVLVEKHAQSAQVAARNAKKVQQAFRDGGPMIEVVRQSVQSYLEGQSSLVSTSSTTEETDWATQAPISAGSPLVDPVETSREPASGHFDIILLDPPYDLGEAELTANLAALAPLLASDGVVLVERSSRTPEPTWPASLAGLREKRYGETVLWWAEAT